MLDEKLKSTLKDAVGKRTRRRMCTQPWRIASTPQDENGLKIMGVLHPKFEIT